MNAAPNFNPNAPGVILLGQIILDYSNQPGNQNGPSNSTPSSENKQNSDSSSAPEGSQGPFDPNVTQFFSNMGPPKVYFSGPCAFGGPPDVPHVPPQFVYPPGGFVPPSCEGDVNTNIFNTTPNMGSSPIIIPPVVAMPAEPAYQQLNSPQWMAQEISSVPAAPSGPHPQNIPQSSGPPCVSLHSSVSGSNVMSSVNSSGDFGEPTVVRSMEPLQKKIDGSGEAIDDEAEYAMDAFIETSAGNQDADIQGCESISSEKLKIYNPNAREFYPCSSSDNLHGAIFGNTPPSDDVLNVEEESGMG